MGTITMQNVRDMSYKLLNEYQTVTANVDLNIVNRVDEQINLCYMELATKDRISASFWIAQFPISNLLYPNSVDNDYDVAYGGGMFITDSYQNTALTYAAQSAASYYFEVDNNCDVDIYEISAAGTATLQTLNITGVSVFTQYVGFITAVSGADTIQLAFYTSGATFDVKNVASYGYTFNGVTASIPYYQPWVEYQIPDDYYGINRMRMRYYNDYRNFSDYRIDNDINNKRRVLIPRDYRAEFVFEYWKLPSAVASGTETFQIRDAYAYIIPWGVAGTIMLGNGFNARVGQLFLDMYEKKKNNIKLDHDFGYMKLDNIKGW
jgi:hypothetical protein